MNNAQPTILVVDDDAFFRQLVVRLLTPLNYRVLEARTVSDAVAALNLGPDLAIIDYRMPGIDGATFIKSLRDQGYKIPIVFCSGSGIDQKTFASMRNVYQVNLIITKPIQPENFIQLVGELLPQRVASSDAEEHTIADEYNCEYQKDDQIERETINDREFEIDHEDIAINDREFETENENLIEIENADIENEQKTNHETDHVIDSSSEADDAIAELANMYLLELPDLFAQMRLEINLAAAQKDVSLLETASNRAHQVRGTAGSLGFATISELGTALETEINELAKSELSDQDARWAIIGCLIDEAALCTEKMINPESSQDWIQPAELTATNCALISDQIILAPVLPLPSSSQPTVRLNSRLLVVEVNPDNTKQIRSIFESENMIVRSVLGAMEAFAVMDDFQPDAVLLQIAMPGVSGIEMCRMIRCNSRWQNLPVIMLCESLTAATRFSLFEAGASDFALVPIVAAELKVRIKSHLQLSMDYAMR